VTWRRLAPVALVATCLTGFASKALAEPRADWGLPAVTTGSVRPWLGIIVTEIESTDAERQTPGVSIARIAPGSPAESAGLLAGDVLLGIDDAPMTSPDSLVTAVRGHVPGSTLVASILRGGKVLRIPITLGAQPEGWDAVRRVIARVQPGDGLPEREVDDVLLQFAGRHQRASLGIETSDLGDGLARYFGAPEGQGVLVASVEAGSPGAVAGLRAGDVVLALDGQSVTSGTSLTDRLRAASPGQLVTVDYLRDKTRRSVAVKLVGRDVPVWIAEPDAASAQSLASLADHNRREARRLQEVLDALEAGNRDVASYVRSPGGGAATRESSAQEIASLQKELDALKERIRELEQRMKKSQR
jgi:S1-C subfamily serine protease